MDNLTAAEQKRLKLIQQIQEMYQSGISIREITRRFQINRQTTKKYLNGNPLILCRSNKRSNLDQHKDFIIKCLADGKTQSETARIIKKLGCDCGEGNIRQYIRSIATQYQLEVKKYVSSSHDTTRTKQKKTDYITRKGIFQYLWLNGELTIEHHEYLWNKYNILQEIEKCIREFREIFRTKKMPLLYLFIEHYKNSSVQELSTFANGLEKDISAVENAVASDLSNAFVEGTNSNSKVKMVKRTMYGRCGRKLLAAKLMYSPA